MAALIPSQLYGADEEKPADRGSLLGSAALAVGASIARDVVAPAAELFGEATGAGDDGVVGAIAKTARNVGDKVDTYIPEERRLDRDAAFIPEGDQRSVFKNPGSSAVMKIAGSLAPMAAYVASGPFAPVTGAALGVGTRLSEVKGQIEKASEDDLIKQFPKYVEYMTLGLPENEARKLLVDDMLKGTMVPAAAGGAAGAFAYGRAFHLGGGRGLIKGTAVGAGEGAVGGALEGAGREISNQQGEMNVGKRADYNPVSITHAMVNAGLEGGVLGGGAGGAGSLVGKGRDKAGDWAAGQLDKKKARDAAKVDGDAPDPAQTEALTPDGPTALDAQIDAAAAGSPDALKPPGAPDPNAPPGTTPPPGAPPPAAGPSEAVVNAIHAAATKRMKAGEIHDALVASLGDKAPSPTEVINILSGLLKANELTKNKGGYRTTRQAAPKTPPLAKTSVTVAEAVEAAKPPVVVETKRNVPGEQDSPVAAGVMDVVKPPETAVAKTDVPGDEASTAALTMTVTPEGKVETPAPKKDGAPIGVNAAGETIIEREGGRRAVQDNTGAWVLEPFEQTARDARFEPTEAAAPKSNGFVSEERIAGMKPLARAFARKLNRRFVEIAETQGQAAAEAWVDRARKRVSDKNGKFQQSLAALGSAVDKMNAGVAKRGQQLTAAGDALTGKGAPKSLANGVPTADALAAPVVEATTAPKKVSEVRAKVNASVSDTKARFEKAYKEIIEQYAKGADASEDAKAKADIFKKHDIREADYDRLAEKLDDLEQKAKNAEHDRIMKETDPTPLPPKAKAAPKTGTLTAEVAPKTDGAAAGEAKTGVQKVSRKIPLTADDIKIRNAIKAKLTADGKPGSDDTTDKVARIVKRNMAKETEDLARLKKLQDEAAAKAAAEAKASGKPSVFKRTELPPRTPEERLQWHIATAFEELNGKKADQRRTDRNIKKDANEEGIETLARDYWDTETDNEARKALGGDGEARRSVMQRVHNMLAMAVDQRLQLAKNGYRVDRPEESNTTPWRKYLWEADKFNTAVKKALNEQNPTERARQLNEAFTEFLTRETEVRGGKELAKETVTSKGKVDAETALSVDWDALKKKAEAELAAAKKAADAAGKKDAADEKKTDAQLKLEEAEALAGGKKKADTRDDLEKLADKDDADVDAKERVDEGNAKIVTASERAARVQQGMNRLHAGLEAGTVASTEVTLKEHLDGLGSPGDGPGDKALASAVKRKLLEQGGDSIVHIIPDAVWDAYGLERVGGSQFRNKDPAKPGIIMLPKRWSRDPLVVIHEGVHEITSRAVDLDHKFRADVRSLMDQVLEKIPEFRREYGFHNEHEFLAETAANPEFRDILRGVDLDKPVVTRWGIARTAWDKLIDMTFKLLNLKSRHEFNALDMAMRAVGEGMHLDAEIKSMAQSANTQRAQSSGMGFKRVDYPTVPGSIGLKITDGNLRVSPREYFEARVPAKIDWKLRTQRVLDKVASVVQMTNNSDHLYGPDRPARQLAEAMGKMSTMKNKILSERAEPLIKNMHAAQRAFDQRTDGRSQWTDFAELAHDASRAGVHPDQIVGQQFKKDNLNNWYQTEVHKDLSTRYNKMPQELKDLFHEATGYFRETQNQMSMGLIRNALKAASSDGKGSEALAQRIFNKKLTDADKAVLGKDGLLASIQKAGALSRIEGPYVPFMRRGDFVVTARHEIEAPAGARRINDAEADDAQGNTYEFKTEDAAKAFVQQTLVKAGLRPTDVSKLGIDATTGSHYRLDAEGKKKPINFKEEPNAETRWRVTIEPKHVEFHEQASAAAESRQGLIEKGLRDVTHVDVKKLDPAKMNDAFMPLQMQRMLNALQKREGFKKLDKNAQDELVRQLREAGIAAMGSTRAQSHRLPRNNILGNSEDILKNTGVYASSTAGYLARLRYRPDVDAALKKMTDYTDNMTRAGNDEYLPALRRQRLNELTKRAHAMNDIEADNMFHRVTSRLLQLSYLDKLASPAFHAINSSEPWTITLPVLAARHGVLPTIKALSSAYNLIGGRTIVGAGMRDTWRAGRKGHNADLTDYQTTLTQRVAKDAQYGADLVKLFNHLHDVGLMSRDAGMELSRITDASTGRVGRTADRADLMARQVGAAIESVNRAVSAVSAYKMERAKGADHAKAMEYAVEQVHDTMKDYASWNAAPIFNHPVGRLALQFKKYAQGTYYLLGKTAIASFKGDKQAMKTFAYLMATHMVTAGALGMPLEPIRLGLMAAGLLGITDKTYEDFEQGVRAGGANVLGVEGGQIFTRGLARWAGIDLASRVSFNSLLTSGQDPKSMKPDDLWAWLAKNLAGAPASLLIDGVQGFQALGKGDVVEASRLLVPLKIWADSVQAYQWNTEGKKSASGRQQMEPVSFGDALVKVAGFTPGSVAERNEKTFAIKGDQRQFKKARDQLSNDWINASPDEKMAMWREIEKWNAGQPANAKIKMNDLMNQKRRRDQEKFSDDRAGGMNLSKRDRHLLSSNDYYNVSLTR